MSLGGVLVGVDEADRPPGAELQPAGDDRHRPVRGGRGPDGRGRGSGAESKATTLPTPDVVHRHSPPHARAPQPLPPDRQPQTPGGPPRSPGTQPYPHPPWPGSIYASESLFDRFKDRHALHVMRHRYDVGLSRLRKSAGHSNLIGSRPGLLASRASNERHGRQPALAAWGPPPQCAGPCVFKLVDEEVEKPDRTPPAPSVDVPKCVGRPHRPVSATPKALGSNRTVVYTRDRPEVIPLSSEGGP